MSILEFCMKRGFRPGSLLVAKEHTQLGMIFGDLDEALAEQVKTGRSAPTTIPICEGSVLLFVDGHGVRLGGKDGPWDFWYEFLLEDRIAYIHAFDLGRMQLKLFDIRTP